MIAIIIILAWLFCAGMAYPLVLDRMVKNCPWDTHATQSYSTTGVRGSKPDREVHRPSAIGISVFGPIVLPFLLGSLVTGKTDALEAKRIKEIAAAEHQKKVAKIQAEALALLEREAGIK